MHIYEFRCPQCSARLRCRDRSWAGRRIQCPDCRAAVLVSVGNDGNLCAAPDPSPISSLPPGIDRSTAATEQGRSAEPDNPADAGLAAIRQPRSFRERVVSPAGIGWMVAGGIALILVGVYLVETGGTNQGPDVSAAGPPVAEGDAGDDGEPGPAAAHEDRVEDRLQALSGWIDRFVADQGEFPSAAARIAGPPPDRPMSWQAILVESQHNPPGPRAQWERAWNDPLNDQFVRRRIDTLLNPRLDQPTGMQGYPATHFAGISGVGADAVELPKQHPRAGIFGTGRRTTRDDVADGLANTMLVAGVDERLTSWAAGGAGTVRGFTREPYVNGPDGFGTGQADGMHVLMADGSVRFLSSETDPGIIRRMAAMADGLPLDMSVPGEPGDAASPEAPGIAAADGLPDMALPPDPLAGRIDDEAPLDVVLAEDAPLFDVAAALEFPVAEFVQTTPVSLLDMLYQWEEMAGVPIDATPLDAEPTAVERLQRNVTLSLSDTTVGEILGELLEQAGLRYDAGPFGVRLQLSDP